MRKNRRDGSCNTNGQVTLSGAPLLANLIMARRYIVARRSYHSCSRCVRSHPAADTWSVLRAGVAGQIPAGRGISCGIYDIEISWRSLFSNDLEPTNDLFVSCVCSHRVGYLYPYRYLDPFCWFVGWNRKSFVLPFLFFVLVVIRDPKRLHIIPGELMTNQLIENWFDVKSYSNPWYAIEESKLKVDKSRKFWFPKVFRKKGATEIYR